MADDGWTDGNEALEEQEEEVGEERGGGGAEGGCRRCGEVRGLAFQGQKLTIREILLLIPGIYFIFL